MEWLLYRREQTPSPYSQGVLWYKWTGQKLQAASLVHLGNSMIKSSLPTYIIMAIYITDGYIAHKYTFYQKTHQKVLVFAPPAAAKWLNAVIVWCLLFLHHALPIVQSMWSVQVHFPTLQLCSFNGSYPLLAFWGFRTTSWTTRESVQTNALLKEAEVWGWFFECPIS